MQLHIGQESKSKAAHWAGRKGKEVENRVTDRAGEAVGVAFG